MDSGSAVGKSAAGRRAGRASSSPTARGRAPASTSASIRPAPTAPIAGVELGHEELVVVEARRPRAAACTAPSLAATPPMKATGGSMTLPLAIVPLKLRMTASHRPSQHLGRLVALLLGVDHVALGEHAAAAGDAGGLAGGEHDVADVLDVVEQAAGLLVHERAGAGGAVAVGLVVGDAGAAASSPSVSRRRNLEVSPPISKTVTTSGCSAGDAARDGLELVLEARLERLADQPAARAGDAHAAHGAGRHAPRSSSSSRACGGLARAALDAPVARGQHGRARRPAPGPTAGLEEVGSPAAAARRGRGRQPRRPARP